METITMINNDIEIIFQYLQRKVEIYFEIGYY